MTHVFLNHFMSEMWLWTVIETCYILHMIWLVCVCLLLCNVLCVDSVDVLHLFGVCGDSSSVVHDHKDGWSRVHHHTLSVLSGSVSSALSGELAVALSRGGILRSDRCGVRCGSDHLLLWFLLSVLHQRSARSLTLLLLLLIISDWQ